MMSIKKLKYILPVIAASSLGVLCHAAITQLSHYPSRLHLRHSFTFRPAQAFPSQLPTLRHPGRIAVPFGMVRDFVQADADPPFS